MLFWSASSQKSEWVRLELNMAFIRLLQEKAIRLKVILLDKTTLPLYLKPFHFLDISASADPVSAIVKRLGVALKEPTKAQRQRFLNRGTELERIEATIWSCPYQTGHPSSLLSSLLCSLGDFIFNPLWG